MAIATGPKQDSILYKYFIPLFMNLNKGQFIFICNEWIYKNKMLPADLKFFGEGEYDNNITATATQCLFDNEIWVLYNESSDIKKKPNTSKQTVTTADIKMCEWKIK